MNDYLGTSHEAIFYMVHEGEPGEATAWARCVTGVSRDLGSQLESLREHSARISSVWSDGAGSVRLTADLNAVIDYLQVLADGLFGQSASYADLTMQAAADLAAAQPPSVLPPPPSGSPAGLSAGSRRIDGSWLEPAVIDLQTGQMAHQIAATQAAWIKAGETATTLDNQYRTALARLTPPPAPPPIVLNAATGGEAAAAPAVTGATAAVGGVWAADRQVRGGPTGSSGSVDAGGSVDSSRWGWAGARLAGVTGGGVVDWSGSAVVSAAMLSGGGSVLRSSRPRIDAVILHGGHRAGSVGAGSVGAGSVGAGSAGPARFDSGTGAGVSTAAVVGVGRVAAPAGGVLLSRGSAEAVTAAGLSRGFGAAGIGAGSGILGSTVAGSGVAGNGPSGFGGAGAGATRSASDSARKDGAGPADPAAGSARGGLGGAPGAASISLVKGGQIGQAGLPPSGTAGVGIGRPGAPGAGVGGEHGYRVTWLVEDRDLYGRGPSVKPVIEAAPDAG